jgi:DNA-binding beta-propeller fold protein YncE
MHPRIAAAAALLALAVPVQALATPPAPSGLTRVGCVVAIGGTPLCTPSPGVNRPTGGAVSPDGRNVYVPSGGIVGASTETGSIAAFSRSTATGPGHGALTQLSGGDACVSFNADNTGGADFAGCGVVSNNGPAGQIYELVVSPDGKHVYATSRAGKAIVWFARSTTEGPGFGALAYAGCISALGAGGCSAGPDAGMLTNITISADGRNVYAASNLTGTVISYRRNDVTGGLTSVGCIIESGLPSAIGCTGTGRGIVNPVGIAISPDDKNVYTSTPSSSDGVAAFTRDMSGMDPTGALSQIAGEAGCITATGFDHEGHTAGACAQGRGLVNPYGPAISGDGLSIYTGSNDSDAVAIISRDPATGGISQVNSTAACLSHDADGPGGADPVDSQCAGAPALAGAQRPYASSDGKSLYVSTGKEYSGVTIFDRAPDGSLTPLAGKDACFSVDPANDCVTDETMSDPTHIFGFGRSVYVSSFLSRAVTFFQREESSPPSAPAIASVDGQPGADTQVAGESRPDSQPGPSPEAASSDTVAPLLGTASFSPKRFAVARRSTPLTARAKKTGSSLRFKLSERSDVTIAIQRRAGRRWRKVATLVRPRLAAGKAKIVFTGKIGKRTLKPGRYRAVVTAKDQAGNRSKPRTALFAIIRR